MFCCCQCFSFFFLSLALAVSSYDFVKAWTQKIYKREEIPCTLGKCVLKTQIILNFSLVISIWIFVSLFAFIVILLLLILIFFWKIYVKIVKATTADNTQVISIRIEKTASPPIVHVDLLNNYLNLSTDESTPKIFSMRSPIMACCLLFVVLSTSEILILQLVLFSYFYYSMIFFCHYYLDSKPTHTFICSNWWRNAYCISFTQRICES